MVAEQLLTGTSDRNEYVGDLIHPKFQETGISIEAESLMLKPKPERLALDSDILRELKKIPDLSDEEKERIFEGLKVLPPKDRIWFLADLMKQMKSRRKT